MTREKELLKEHEEIMSKPEIIKARMKQKVLDLIENHKKDINKKWKKLQGNEKKYYDRIATRNNNLITLELNKLKQKVQKL